jgi:superfamily II DNA/RNA helicase
MYNNTRSFSRPQGNSRGGRPSFGGGRSPQRGGFHSGGQRRGGYPMRSFDPSQMVGKAVVSEPEPDYVPVRTFADFAIHPDIKGNVAARGYIEPTQIQDEAIPYLLEGRDLIGIANTGTGKTAAFLLPLINKVLASPREKVLIVAPTRELAVQIDQEFRLFARGLRLYSAICIGGVNMHGQVQALRRQPQFVIGTPGRLKDLESQRVLDFRQFNSLVLDEVDQMLDMGFIPDVRFITGLLPKERQTMFFSATMPDRIMDLTREFLTNAMLVEVVSRRTSQNIDQDIVRTNGQNKVDVLHQMLNTQGFDKVLVFLRTKRSAEKLVDILNTRGLPVASIHGNKSQGQRQRAINDFKSSRVRILLATDVAARGLDIDDVTHVINFDLPETRETYLHRIGRTGRADKKGVALTFVD